ncbi:MAG: hypothetical protein U0175_33165 [Caldilineaceae bacterium]
MTVPRRFGILRFVGNLLKVFAWIVLIIGILMAVGVIVAGPQIWQQVLAQLQPGARTVAEPILTQFGGITLAVPVILFSLIYFFSLYVTGETMLMQLAVEENTRLTAALLLRMHQETQPEPQGRAAGYDRGYNSGFDDR